MLISTIAHLKAAFPFRHILLGVKEDNVDFGHIEHPQRHRGRQAEGDGQGGGLDIHLNRHRERGVIVTFQHQR